MRIGAAMALLAALALSEAACTSGELFKQYEYEEDVYLSLDGSAIVYVNSSVAALDALRGASFDTASNAVVDRDAVRAWFTTPVTQVTRRPTLSRRGGRRFVHVRLDADDVRSLSQAAPLAWSTYSFGKDGDFFAYRQVVGVPAGKGGGDPGWTGDEIVALVSRLEGLSGQVRRSDRAAASEIVPGHCAPNCRSHTADLPGARSQMTRSLTESLLNRVAYRRSDSRSASPSAGSSGFGIDVRRPVRR